MPPDEGKTQTSVGGSEAESTEEALSDAAATAGTDEISRSTEDSVATNKVTQAGVMPSWAPAIYGMAVAAPRAEMIRTKYGSSSSGFVHQGQKVTAMPDGDTSATEAIDGATPVNERHAEIEAVEHNAAVGSYDPSPPARRRRRRRRRAATANPTAAAAADVVADADADADAASVLIAATR